MTRTSRFVLAAGVFLLPPTSARAQNLAQRIASAPDGAVQFTFAARPGVCGNGRTYYTINGSMWFGTMNDYTRTEPCQPGPVRVVLGRAGREIVDVNSVLHGVETKLVAFSQSESRLGAATRQPHRKSVGVMVAAVVAPLHHRRATKLASPYHQRVLKQAALF